MATSVFNMPNNHHLDEDLAIVQNGSTATVAISSGQYVSWNGVLKRATTSIAIGDTFSVLNLESSTDGILNDINDSINSIIDTIYPIGSIYMSANSTNPSTLFSGTTWTQIQDTFLLAAGTTYTAGATGGSDTHTLTVSEMPSHNHTFTGSSKTSGTDDTDHSHGGPSHSHSIPNNNVRAGGSDASSSHVGFVASPSSGVWAVYQTSTDAGGTGSTGGRSATHKHTLTAGGSVGNNGNGTAFSIMPPYLAVYVWRRTA